MTDDIKFNITQFPAKIWLQNELGMPIFTNSKEGKRALRKKKSHFVDWMIIDYLIIPIILFAIYLWASKHFLSGKLLLTMIIEICILLPIFAISFGVIKKGANELYYKEKKKYCELLTKKLINDFFHDSRCFCYNEEALIYNNNIFLYLSTETGVMVIYNKSNIKDVNKERFRVGSEIYRSGVIIESYEWHFDILTDFLGCPKISFILPDTRYIENELGNMYAILKP